jgi:hypothetical protein
MRWSSRSSSAAKNLEAAFRIALARLSLAFSRFKHFSSADSPDVARGRVPATAAGTHYQAEGNW